MKLRGRLFETFDNSKLSQTSLPAVNLNKSYITSHSHLQNQKYSKTFEVLQSTENSQIPKISKTHPGSHYCKFDKIVEKLDIVVHESRFLNKRITLVENSPVSGYIEEGTFQYFEVLVRDFFSPLRVKIVLKKGVIQSFASFKNPSPDNSSYDKTFETPYFEIHSPNPVFIDQKCFLSIFAISGSSLKIRVSFGGSLLYKRSKANNSIGKMDTKLSYQSHIKDLRENPDLRNEFDEKVQKIIEKRKINFKSNFIEKNKSLQKSLVMKPSLDFKIKKVQEQKQHIQKSRSESILAKLNKTILKKQTETELKNLKALLWFRKFYEETWFKLIYMSLFAAALKDRFENRKKIKMFRILSSMQAYKIQKNFCRTYPKVFSIKYRNLALCRNNLLLFKMVGRPEQIRTARKVVFKTIQTVSYFKSIPRKFKLFHKCAVKIQRYWRDWKGFYESLMELFLRFWNKTNEGLVSFYSGNNKVKRKRKVLILEKLANITDDKKKECVKNYLYECRMNLLNCVKRSQTLREPYPRDKEKFKKIILGLCKERMSTLKKTK